MNIQITNVNMTYEEGAVKGVQVFFHGYDAERTINLSGFIPLTADEYAGNESIDNLNGLIHDNLSARFVAE